MKYLLFSLLICAGCTNIKDDKLSDNVTKIINVDNCQYITMENGGNWMNNYSLALTHKGNCTNVIHIYK